MINPYEELAQAIILLAAKDYRKTIKRLAKNPCTPKLMRRKKDLEAFFLSSRFAVLTSLDGRRLLLRLQAEAKGVEGKE